MSRVWAAAFALLFAGCFGSAACTWQGYTAAKHSIWWRGEHSTADIAEVMLARGWRTLAENESYESFEPPPAPTPAGGMLYGPELPQHQRASYALPLNDSATVLAIDSTTIGARDRTLTDVTFVVPGSVVGNSTGSQTMFAGRIDPTLAALMDAFGQPEHSTWIGGKQHCGAI